MCQSVFMTTISPRYADSSIEQKGATMCQADLTLHQHMISFCQFGSYTNIISGHNITHSYMHNKLIQYYNYFSFLFV